MTLPKISAALLAGIFFTQQMVEETSAREMPEQKAPVAREPAEKTRLPPAEREDKKKAEFSLKFRDEVSPYEVIAVFTMPGEEIIFEPVLGPLNTKYRVEHQGGELAETDAGRWRWTAPAEKGLYPITFTAVPGEVSITANAFVMVPESEVKKGELGEFRVGTYPPDDDFGKKARYEAPPGFVEVTEANRDDRLSPHLTLGEFVSRQASQWPKYVFLRERLLLKLEMLHEHFNRAGYEVDTFHIMSGYRTPFYNESIGNAEFSRHVYGDAADIFIDNDGDGRMDDLNGDGESNYADAVLLKNLIEDLVDRPWYQPFIGGLGVYGEAPHRGPFIHVDTRGYRARWESP